LGSWGTALVHFAITVGMLAIVPLGLSLIEGTRGLVRVWLAGALPGAVSLWLPRGALASVLAAVYCAVTLALAVLAVRRFWHQRSLRPTEIAALTALAGPVIASSSLVAERNGYPLMGFDLDVLTLTVAHFHYAGFVAALVAGLVCRAAPGRLASAAAVSVPAGIGLVFLGYFTEEWVELVGAVVLTAGMWLVAWATWRRIRPGARDRVARILFGTSAVVLSVTMLLAVDWALAHVIAVPHLTMPWMAATHGVVNAFGFALCAVLAWRKVGTSPL
jgi:YndJ-like protein